MTESGSGGGGRRPRARVMIVDGAAWPVARSAVLHGRAVGIRGATNARIVDTERLELLVEDAPVPALGAVVARMRGVDALLIVAGGEIKRYVDVLAIAGVMRVPRIIIVSTAQGEAPIRALFVDAGLDGDGADIVRPPSLASAAPSSIAEGALPLLDALAPRAPVVRIVADGTHALIVSGETPVSARSFALVDEGWQPTQVALPSIARAGDVIALPGTPWLAVDDEPHPCIAGRVPLATGRNPPRGTGVLAFTDGGECDAVVDERGALRLQRALPLAPGAYIGVYVTRSPMRPSTAGALGARVLACHPDMDRDGDDVFGRLRRRPSRPDDRERLYELHRAALGGAIARTFGPWDDSDQRRRFDEKFTPGELTVVVDAAAAPGDAAGGGIIGSFRVERRGLELYLTTIAIDPAWQGRGIGGALVDELRAAATRAHMRVALSVLKGNPRARTLYERHGLVVSGETTTHWRLTDEPHTSSSPAAAGAGAAGRGDKGARRR